MNKKHLSVVMAGAMLATSVAPVLAATETTVNESERGLLIKRLRELLLSKSYSDVKSNKGAVEKDAVSGLNDSIGDSAYYVRMNNKNYGANDIKALEADIQAAGNNTVINVYNRGFVEKDGVVYNHYLEDSSVTPKFTEKNLEAAAEKTYPAVIAMDYADGVLKVTTRKAANESEYVTFEYKVGDDRVNFEKPINAKGELITGTNDFSALAGFKTVEKEINKANTNIDAELMETVTLTDVDKSYETTLSNLYDGLFLTANGDKLLDAMREYDKIADANNRVYLDPNGINNDGRGIYSLDITFIKQINRKEFKQVLTIKSNNKDQLEFFAEGIDLVPNHNRKFVRRFPVQVIAGDNRYETAVKVAKEYADIETVAEHGNLVLVNGNSLVDGLAAAPLAASVVNGGVDTDFGNRQYISPILLTNTNGIPAETKAYMKELIGAQRVGELDQLTVYLVGGEAVISKSVENDLKEIGFRVVRAGGKDREATSLAVAKLMERDTLEGSAADAFLVGADGEADAMSIASVAAGNMNPIIVESRHGLSDETMEYIKGYKDMSATDVTIVGGENVVSKETEAKLADEKVAVERIAGRNRQETNAIVIDAFYNDVEGHNFSNVVVSKDGQRNKAELIDALTATSLAVRDHAPIVLGTNKLSAEQINALELNADRDGVYVYQVGNGVAREVVKTIAERIGLAK